MHGNKLNFRLNNKAAIDSFFSPQTADPQQRRLIVKQINSFQRFLIRRRSFLFRSLLLENSPKIIFVADLCYLSNVGVFFCFVSEGGQWADIVGLIPLGDRAETKTIELKCHLQEFAKRLFLSS